MPAFEYFVHENVRFENGRKNSIRKNLKANIFFDKASQRIINRGLKMKISMSKKKKAKKIQAIDPCTGIWTNAEVLGKSENGNHFKVTWPKYSSQYDQLLLVEMTRASQHKTKKCSATL